MKPLGEFEVWFVTGSQEMYGDETLRQVAVNSGLVARPARRVAGDPGPDRPPAGRHLVREHRRHVPGGQRRRRLRRGDPLDAYVLAGPDVDRRAPGAPEAAAPSPHPVQPRSPVGRDRHGLHEPQPGGPWRSRVRLHGEPTAGCPQDRCRSLAGSVRRRSHRRLVARGLRLARGPSPQGRAVRRHDAPCRRHRGRQGRGADPARRDGQRLRRDRPDRCDPGGARTCDRRPAACVRGDYDLAPELCPSGARRAELREAARIEAGLRGFLEAVASSPSPIPSRTSAGSGSCPASPRSG